MFSLSLLGVPQASKKAGREGSQIPPSFAAQEINSGDDRLKRTLSGPPGADFPLPHPPPSSLPVLGLHKYKHTENVKNASKFGSLAAFCLEKYPQMVRTEAKQPQKQNATSRSVRTQLPLSLKTFLAGIPLSKCGGRADKTG